MGRAFHHRDFFRKAWLFLLDADQPRYQTRGLRYLLLMLACGFPVLRGGPGPAYLWAALSLWALSVARRNLSSPFINNPVDNFFE